VLLLVTALSVAALGQRAQNNTDEQLAARNAPDVFVYSASAFGPNKDRESSFTIEVENTGRKTISAIEWEYYLPAEIGGIKFRSADEKLGPGDRKKLTSRIKRYTNELIANYRLNHIRIVRVEYDDGSAWQRAADEK
jgi:hypothetical protein